MPSKTSAKFEFFAFLFFFGWEGPLSVWMGIEVNNFGVVLVGVFLTLLFWMPMGIPALKELIIEMTGKE